jgi:hypothetical protein
MTPTRACAGCGTQLDARWAFCPECGARPPRACASCAQPLEATWRLCPFCGASAAAPGAEAARPHTEPSSVAIATTAAATQPPDLVLSWSLAGRLQAIYTRPLLKALEVVNRAPDVPSALALMEPAVMRRACGVGVSALAEQRTQTWVPEALRPRLAALAADGERLLRPLEPSLRDLGAAIAMARGVELSTGAADAALQLVRNVNDERTAASRGYAIGAEIGRAFKHPVIGAVVGAMFGQNQADHRSQQLLAQVDRTFVAFCRECDELFPQIWDRLVADVPEPSLAGSARLRTGVDEWERLLASYPDMTNQDVLRFRDEVTTFVDVHGPVPGAAHALIRSTLPPYTPIAFDIAEPWVRFQLAVFPAEPTAYEDAADVALARGALGECHTLVNQGLQLDGTHHGLLLTKLEVVSALGRADEAEALVRRVQPDHPHARLTQARGRLRAGDVPDAARIVDGFLHAGADPIVVGQAMYNDLLLAPLAASGTTMVCTRLEADIARIAARHLPNDQQTHFLGLPTRDQFARAMTEFLRLAPRERVIYFRDWSVFANGATGFVITTRHVFWKCLWEQPVALPLEHWCLDRATLRYQGSLLCCGNLRVDLADADLAASTMQALAEINALVRNAGWGAQPR